MTTKRRLTGLVLTGTLLSVPMLGYAGKQVFTIGEDVVHSDQSTVAGTS